MILRQVLNAFAKACFISFLFPLTFLSKEFGELTFVELSCASLFPIWAVLLGTDRALNIVKVVTISLFGFLLPYLEYVMVIDIDGKLVRDKKEKEAI